MIARAAVLAICMASPVLALEVETGEFAYASELAAEGYTPFATSGALNSVFGMEKDGTLYLCFSMDSGSSQAERQRTLLAELESPLEDRAILKIPLVCIPTQ
jgi:hypothetical protein